jgi:hypothetical protein
VARPAGLALATLGLEGTRMCRTRLSFQKVAMTATRQCHAFESSGGGCSVVSPARASALSPVWREIAPLGPSARGSVLKHPQPHACDGDELSDPEKKEPLEELEATGCRSGLPTANGSRTDMLIRV